MAGRVALAGVLALAGVAVASERQGREIAGERGARPTRAEVASSRVTEVLGYQASGVRDGTAAATVVHCTNLGGADRSIYIDIYGFDGFLECTMGVLVGPDGTATFATRATALYVEDETCAEAPGTDQGSLDIYVTISNTVICTVQVVDPAAATPAYATTLDLFRR